MFLHPGLCIRLFLGIGRNSLEGNGNFCEFSPLGIAEIAGVWREKKCSSEEGWALGWTSGENIDLFGFFWFVEKGDALNSAIVPVRRW